MNTVTTGLLHGWFLSDVCLIPHARNNVIRGAYENFPDFTHLLFIDDDMDAWNIAHVKKLWECNVDYVSALMVMRRPPYRIVSHFGEMTDSEVWESIQKGELLKVPYSGTGFTMFSRKLLDETREETVTGPVWFTMDRRPRDSFEAEAYEKITQYMKEYEQANSDKIRRLIFKEAVEYGTMAHIGSEMAGEDIAFSLKAKDFGFDMYVDCGCQVGHVGQMSFDWRAAFTQLMANKGVIRETAVESQLKLVQPNGERV